MADRPAAPSERAPACPFVAYEDDRDERSDRPDRRHRCYAETVPAPRAIAHQESFCLSSTFPTCPTFQDWARHEAARPRTMSRQDQRAGDREDAAMAGQVGVIASTEAAGPDDVPAAGLDVPDSAARSEDSRPSGTARDWAGPPPWLSARSAARGRPPLDSRPGATSAAAAVPDADPDATPARAPADPAAGLAASRWLADVQPGDEGLDLAAGEHGRASPGTSSPTAPGAGGAERAAAPRDPIWTTPIVAVDAEPLAGVPHRDLTELVSKTRSGGRRAVRPPSTRPIVGQARPVTKRPPEEEGPSWERPRRFEAYPTLRTRVGMPAIPRIAVAAIALVVAAVVLFMAPALFFSKGDQAVVATPSPSVAPSVSFAPTSTPAPTELTYVIKAGDTLGRIASHFNVTQTQLLQANPQIKDPNRIAIGQVIVIPGSAASQVIVSGPTGPSVAPGASSSTGP
ncbi:MAG: LysM peptidoglycan-binding domain-containing protein [Chloroflexi bacterium]|nr:LysM peptidoglycan-binding domain-containing protein [Chloroflexota bacterium]